MDSEGNSLDRGATEPDCKDDPEKVDSDMDSNEFGSEGLGRWSFLCCNRDLDQSQWSSSRQFAALLVESQPSEMIMSVLIMFNVILLVIEVDRNAACNAVDPSNCESSRVLSSLNHVLLGVYTIEIGIRFYAYRLALFCGPWNLLDAFIVLTGLFDFIMSSTSARGLPNLQMFRMFRLFKLLRTVRLLVFFPELYELVRGFAGALKAMLWGAFLIGIMLGVWSLMAAEIAPAPAEMVLEGPWDHPWCREAFSSVLMATLFFFQTLVAGDSWGQCAIPIMRQSPGSVVIFVGALVSVQLGFTNLILAVIVDAAAGAREKDHEARLREKRKHEQQSLEHWRTIVETLDVDCSGTISLEELMTGFQTQPEVMKCFQLLDVDHGDLESFFLLMDCDESGDLSYKEFFHCLRKAHSQDLRMYLMNVKLQISRISHLLSKQMAAMTEGFQALSTQTVAMAASAQVHKPTVSLSERAQQLRAVFSSEPGKPQAVPTVQPSALSERAEQLKGLLSEPLKSQAVPAKPEHESLNHLCMRLEVQLEKLTQDADANAALLVQNTKMLEALLASFGLGETMTSLPSRSASTNTVRRCEGRGPTESSGLPQLGTQGVTQAVAACLPWTRNGRSPVAGAKQDSKRGHRLSPRPRQPPTVASPEELFSV